MDKNNLRFLQSNSKEADFYNLSTEDLISLKEYYLYMQNLDTQFNKSINDDFESIKGKCNWVNGIGYNTANNSICKNSGIHLLSDDKINIYAEYNENIEQYDDLITKMPKICSIFEGYRTLINRQKDLLKIKEELTSIDKIGSTIYENDICNPKSISKNFDIHYIPCIGMSIKSNFELITTFFEKDVFPETNKIISEKEKTKLLTMIQLKKF